MLQLRLIVLTDETIHAYGHEKASFWSEASSIVATERDRAGVG